jgi:hypothetical protein
MTATVIAKRYSKASPERLAAMQSELKRIDRAAIGGDVVECGVWRGGHIILARMVSPQRLCWLYDTFSGMTTPGPFDRKVSNNKSAKDVIGENPPKRMSLATLDEVTAALKAENVYDESKLRFIVGDVCQTLLVAENLPEKIALLRLDTDWHDSTKMELEVLWPRLVPGGTLICDDYGHWLGHRKAVNDFFAKFMPDFKQRLRSIDYAAIMLVKP